MKYPHFDKLQEYVAQGWVNATKHLELPLVIYNYSRKTQFEKNWDHITIDTRGLVLDQDGNLVAKAFPKFFNYEEIRYQNVIPTNETPIIQKKADGSLGIIFHYNGEWHVATRGSFHSVQAIKAKEIFNKHRDWYFPISVKRGLNPKYTYLVEIVYPENRIVINYGEEEKLIWLSIFNNETGEELSLEDCSYEWGHMLIPIDDIVDAYYETPGTFGEFMFSQLKEDQKPNEEGYIVKFEPSNFRVKIKFEDYIALHKIITNITSYDIWEYLKDGKEISELLTNTPDELDNWVRKKVEELNKQFDYIESECLGSYGLLKDYDLKDRKDQAIWVQNNVIPRYKGIVFAMLDKKNYKEQIWRLCKPKYEKPFNLIQ